MRVHGLPAAVAEPDALAAEPYCPEIAAVPAGVAAVVGLLAAAADRFVAPACSGRAVGHW